MKVMIRREMVLLYRVEGEKEKQVRELLERNRIAVKVLTEEMLGQTLGWCISEAGYEESGVPYEGKAMEREALILSGISGKRLDQLLRDLKALPAGNIELKAVVTPHNKSWKVGDLFAELEKEHHLMGKVTQLRVWVRNWEPKLAAYQGEDAQPLVEALRQAKELLKKGQDITPEACDRVLEQIREAEKAWNKKSEG